MGKGFNNFMSKKAFHPGSFQNQRRIQEAEERTQAKRKKDEELLEQYRKEQELFEQKGLVSKESKEKLSLNFMYELPPGMKKPEEEKKNEKLEWTSSGTTDKAPHSSDLVTPNQVKKSEGICLEWKRDRPISRRNNTSQQIKREPEVKKDNDNSNKNNKTLDEAKNVKRIKTER